MANQAWQIASAGKLVLNDLGPLPTPGPKEILVRVHAISLNYRDILVADHDPAYPLKAKENLIPGSDAAGIVEGTETIIAFVLFCLFPSEFPWLAGVFAGLCFWTAAARVLEAKR